MTPRVWSRLVLWGAAIAPVPGAAQSPDARRDESSAAERWKVDDILLAETAGEFAVAPDGDLVVWVRSQMSEEEGRTISNLWLTRVADGESWPLTRGTDRHTAPRWSPDGRYVAFVSSRDVPGASDHQERLQLWLLRLQGGEPWPLTTEARGLSAFAWKGPHSDTIVFAAQETLAEFERERMRTKDASVAVEDTLEAPPVRLWTIDIDTPVPRRVTQNRDWIREFTVSPDGRHAVTRNAVSLSYDFDAKSPPQIFLVRLDDGTRRRLLASHPRVVPREMAWAPDGSGFYFVHAYSTHPIYRIASVSRAGFYDLTADTFHDIDLKWDREVGRDLLPVPGGFIVLLADGVRFNPARYDRRDAQWLRTLLDGTHAEHIVDWSVSRDGRTLAYVTSTADRPPQPLVAELAATSIRGERRMTTLNPGFARKVASRTEVVRWTGALDQVVEGLLHYPIPYDSTRAHPLIVSIHGGPAGTDLDAWTQRWSYPTILFSQRGAFVLRPNYHGSAGYGLDWVESIGNGSYYDLEIPDIERGVDALIARGLVHRDSIATQGWSNGAILSTELTTRNPLRYRASSAGAGDVEWISDWGNVDFGASFDNYYFGASPLEDPELYVRKSPYFRLGDVRTPTIIFFGADDRAVPPSQGWSHFRALQQLGRTEVRFVLFPDEPHALRKLAHQRRKVNEELRWLDQHLWGRRDTTRLGLQPGSPLAALLRVSRASQVDGRYGRLLSGVLVPETVVHSGVRLGRFEVTRAQWQTFEPSYYIVPGTENYPINWVTPPRARAYVEWLTARTGHVYRIPTEEELKPLVEGVTGGITLEYWAGYAPSLEDTARLQKEVERLRGGAPLLRRAGSYPLDGVGDGPHVYDLGGNVAEWVITASGQVRAMGQSAGSHGGAPAPEYIGLRVVRDH